MEDYIWIFFTIGIFVLWGIISWIVEAISNSKKYLELKPELDNLENSIEKHESKIEKDRKEWKLRVKRWNEKIQRDKEEVEKISKQKSMGFPWLAEAYANYFALKEQSIVNY